MSKRKPRIKSMIIEVCVYEVRGHILVSGLVHQISKKKSLSLMLVIWFYFQESPPKSPILKKKPFNTLSPLTSKRVY